MKTSFYAFKFHFSWLFLQYLNRKKMGCESSNISNEAQPRPIDNQPYIPSKPSMKDINSSAFFTEEQKADWLFSQGKYLEAIAAYKKIIEQGYKLDFEIEGLGNFDMGVYRYDWRRYEWYDEERKAGKFKGNAYDALALCYDQIKQTNADELSKGLFWYEDMLSEKQSYELYIGYAHIYYNLYKYDDALKAYHKFLKMKPNFINAMVSIMFLHEFKRVEKPKAIAMAKKILELDPENMYAHFVLGKNETNVDERIKKLSSGAEKFPRYVRMVNQVGLSYGAKKDHAMAIVYYKKCLEIYPEYAQGYNNVAYRTEMLGNKEQAIKWYYRAVEIDAKYKAAFLNALKVFDDFKWTEDDILAEMKKYPKMDEHNFCYYLGLAYYDKSRYDVALNWYKRALALNLSFNVLNSMGLAYDSTQKYEDSQKCYLKAIKLNPKYKFPYYNMGLMFKHKGDVDKAIQWYKKAIQNDPSYHPPYNNLGNIYRDQGKHKEAIDLYKKSVEIHSTYTLVYCNMAMCYLKQEMYQDAFTAFARAKELLPTDNNGLSQENKAFLKENLQKFDKEGQKWRKTGSIGLQQKEQLKSLIKSFQSNFKTLYSSEASFHRSNEEVLKPGLLQVVNLIYEDKFTLKNIEQIFALIKHIFHDQQQYFHIVPQIFIQYFWNNTIKGNKPILSVEEELSAIIKNISSKQSQVGAPQTTSKYVLDVKMKNFNPPSDCKVNLFKDTAYFNNYEILYSEIVKVNKLAEQSLKQYVDFVEAVRKRSNGIPYGVNMKLPKRTDQQFKVILRILEKMFKKEIDTARVNKIIQTIDNNLKAKGSSVTLLNIVHEIMEVWTKEITNILQERSKKQIETTCTISDLLRGKIMFNTVEDLAKAIDACDKLCHLRGYQIIELDNRLSKPQTMDVVLKIKVNEAVCEFQLAMRQDESKYHFIHSIYEIERSPLGCIFGSYLFMSKGFNYPILANCKDIEERLKTSEKEEDKKTVAAAQYIISSLQEKEKA